MICFEEPSIRKSNPLTWCLIEVNSCAKYRPTAPKPNIRILISGSDP